MNDNELISHIDVDQYIDQLSPELQKKARACTSFDELLTLAEDNEIELPDDVVELVAGGTTAKTPVPNNPPDNVTPGSPAVINNDLCPITNSPHEWILSGIDCYGTSTGSHVTYHYRCRHTGCTAVKAYEEYQ